MEHKKNGKMSIGMYIIYYGNQKAKQTLGGLKDE